MAHSLWQLRVEIQSRAYRHEAALLVIDHGVGAMVAFVDVACDDGQAGIWDPVVVGRVRECAVDHKHSIG